MKESHDRLKIYIYGSFTVLLLCMILAATMFSFQYIVHERERAGIFTRQVNHFFEFEYHAMSEECWTKNYESVITRVIQIAHHLGSRYSQVYLLGKDNECLAYAGNNSYRGSCPVTDSTSFRQNELFQIQDRIKVKPPSSKSEYEVVVNLKIGDAKIGSIYAELSDPFGFESRGIFRFFVDNYLAYILIVLGIWVSWQIISRKYFLQPYLADLIALEKKEALGKLAQRLVHDIRSPLETLLFLVRNASGLPEAQRRQLKAAASRIQSLGDDILVRHTHTNQASDHVQTFTYEVINSIIAEKTVQLENRRLIEVKSEIVESTLLATVAITASDLARVLSNLVNNAIEATEGAGSILILQKEASNSMEGVEIIVRDYGKGMAIDVLNAVLTKGGSFGKVGGAGIGLQHAREVIATVGGKFEINSIPGRGTDVILTLPSSPTPQWLPNVLSFKEQMTIVVIDDDESTHLLWSEKLKDFRLIHLYDPQDFTPKTHVSSNYFYVVDFEFTGSLVTGMDIIERNQLGDRAILVTSYFNDLNVQKSVIAAQCKLLPKFMIPLIAVNMVTSMAAIGGNDQPICFFDLVLIDDDDLVHELWELEADVRGIKILHLRDFDKIYELNIEMNIPIFVDKNLSHEFTGLSVARTLASLGYSMIYLATGEPNFACSETYIKGVVGKCFPTWVERRYSRP